MKYLFISLISVLTVGGIYTNQQANQFAKSLAESAAWHVNTNSDVQSGTVHLGDVLYANIHLHIEGRAGRDTPKEYKTNWVGVVANQPKLVTSAIRTFAPNTIGTFNQTLENEVARTIADYRISTVHPDKIEKESSWFDERPYEERYANQKKAYDEAVADSVAWVTEMNAWTIQSFWRKQFRLINNYETLIDKLLTLSDTQLQKVVTEVLWEQEYCDCTNERLATFTHGKLLAWGIIDKMPKYNYNYGIHEGEEIWYLGQYPLDYLLFLSRQSDTHSNWSPRQILNESKKVIATLEDVLL